MRNSLVIRFRRRGHKKNMFLDIVVIYKRSRQRGRYIEKLGFFNANFSDRLFFVNTKRFALWLLKGAKVNRSVMRYLAKSVCVGDSVD